MTFTACPAEPPATDSSPKTDPALNGKWVYGSSSWTFNNGTFEGVGDVKIKGTFTTSGNTLTYTATHLWGISSAGLQEKWYTRAELKAANPSTFTDDVLNNFFTPTIVTYSISGSTLTLTWEGGTYKDFTKQS